MSGENYKKSDDVKRIVTGDAHRISFAMHCFITRSSKELRFLNSSDAEGEDHGKNRVKLEKLRHH